MSFVDENTVDIRDYKYANARNIDRYRESGQLHVYKDKLEKHYGFKVRNLEFLICPKVMIRQKKTESIGQFRIRLRNTLKDIHPIHVPVEFDQGKVDEFYEACDSILTATDYPKQEKPTEL